MDTLYGRAMTHRIPRRSQRLSPHVVALLLTGGIMGGCAGKIDKITVNRVVARALTVPDVDQSCEIGVSLRSPLAAATKADRPARQALLISEATAAMCDEVAAWGHELEKAKASSDALGLPAARQLQDDVRERRIPAG